MNTIRISFWFIVLLMMTGTARGQDSVTISGKITHPLSDSIIVSYNDNYIAYYPKEFYAPVDKDGRFSLTFPVSAGAYTQAAIQHGKKFAELVVEPGYNLHMTADARHFDSTIHYTGYGSSVENFIASHYLAKGVLNRYTVKVRELIYKEPDDFLKGIAQTKKEELELLDKNKKDLPPSFIKYWEAFYTCYNYFFIQQYPQIHELLVLRRYTDTIPEKNYSVVKAMPYAFSDSLLDVPSYLLYLTGVFDTKLKAAGYTYYRNDTERMRRLEDSVNVLAYKLMPPGSAAYFMAQNIYGRARHEPIEQAREQFATFKKHWPHSAYIPMLEQQMTIAERLAPGMPAPDIDINTPDGKKMKLSDLKGKVVYLGFWASWCRECVGGMLSERKIKTLTGNKPLEFVYVSLDDDTSAANGIINKYKLTGLFTNAKGVWESPEAQLYGVQALPAYYLINEDGKIAMQDAPSPKFATELVLEIERLFK